MKKIDLLPLLLVVLTCTVYRAGAQDLVLSPEKARSLALENNRNLKKAQKEIEAARAGMASAYALGKPTLDGSLGGFYFTEPLTAFLPEVMGNASLTVTQVLYSGGKVQNARKVSDAALGLQNARKELTEDEVLLKTETAYWQVVDAKEKVILANKYIQMLDTLSRDLKNSYDAGLTYKNDLLKVNVQQNEAELNLTKARDGVTMAKLSLAQLTGLGESEFDVQDNIPGGFNGVLKEETISALERRPEVDMLSKAVRINELQEKLLAGDRKPVVALSGIGYGGFGRNVDMVKGKDDVKGFVGMASLSIPIFDWGSRKQKVVEQRFKTDAQKIELDETKEQIMLEIRNIRLSLNQSAQQVALAQKSLQQAEENLRLNQDRFDAGTVLGKDVLEAQVLWQQAYSNLIDAKAGYRINEARYKKAIGDY